MTFKGGTWRCHKSPSWWPRGCPSHGRLPVSRKLHPHVILFRKPENGTLDPVQLLVLHTEVYILDDMFEISGLRDVALENTHQVAEHHNCVVSSCFLKQWRSQKVGYMDFKADKFSALLVDRSHVLYGWRVRLLVERTMANTRKCGPDEHVVHKIIVCNTSEFLDKACSEPLKVRLNHTSFRSLADTWRNIPLRRLLRMSLISLRMTHFDPLNLLIIIS